MRSETAKLPRGQSYALRPSILAAALADAGLGIDTHLLRGPGDLFDAHYWPKGAEVPRDRLFVRAGSVPAARAAEARTRVEKLLLPELIGWISGIVAHHEASPARREPQRLILDPP